MIGIFGALGIISDIVSLSQGEIPLGSVIKMMPSSFRKKKGMSKAQSKKKMMMLQRQRMRRLVDTVIAPQEKKLQQARLEARINEEKAKIDKKKKDTLSAPRTKISPSGHRRNPNPKLEKSRKKYGNYSGDNDDENEDKHLSMIQHIISQGKANQELGFVDKVNKSRGENGSSNSR